MVKRYFKILREVLEVVAFATLILTEVIILPLAIFCGIVYDCLLILPCSILLGLLLAPLIDILAERIARIT